MVNRFCARRTDIFYRTSGQSSRYRKRQIARKTAFYVVSDVELSSETGLMGMALHPDFAENHLLYFAYVYETSGDKFVRVVRYKETGETLIEPKTIIEGISAAKYHAGMRLGFGPTDGKLYITTGDATKQKLAQDLIRSMAKLCALMTTEPFPKIIRLSDKKMRDPKSGLTDTATRRASRGSPKRI